MVALRCLERQQALGTLINNEDMMSYTKNVLTPLALGLALTLNAEGVSAARDYIHIVGSSTLAPLSKAVAEQLAKGSKKSPGLKSPWLESTGTKGGLQLFCEGEGDDFADITNTARRMTRKEWQQCQTNGVRDIIEVAVGRDALVLAQSKKNPPMKLTRRDIYLSLTRMVPDAATKTTKPNPNKNWKQINAALPDRKIAYVGPPANAGLREVFRDLLLEPGCDGFPWLKAQANKNSNDYKRACQDVRSDGTYLDVAVNDPTTVRELTTNEAAIGLMNFGFFNAQKDKLAALEVDGVTPSESTVSSATYPLTGTLYFYVKKSHVGKIPGLAKFIEEFTSEKAFGDKGYLVAKGLIPLAKVDRKVSTDIAKLLAPAFAP